MPGPRSLQRGGCAWSRVPGYVWRKMSIPKGKPGAGILEGVGTTEGSILRGIYRYIPTHSPSPGHGTWDTPPPPPQVLAITTYTVGKRAVRILLECFLVIPVPY